MIVLEGFGELLEVFGGSRSGQAGSMSTKRYTCQRLGALQKAITPSGASSKSYLRIRARLTLEASRARLSCSYI